MQKRVVIVGGGFAGSNIARVLEKDKRFSVTLIDTKDYFEFTPGVLRVLVEPEHIKKIQVLHKHYLVNSKVINDRVIEIRDKSVILKNGKKVKFDYLVLSSGSFYNRPFKCENILSSTRAHDLAEDNNKLKKAKKIVIVGGGIVSVEMSGEIVNKYKNKELTIIHSKNRLIERNPKRASDYAEKYLKGKGVKIIFNIRASKFHKKMIELENGEKIKCDLVFLAVGITPHSEMIRNEFKKYLDEKGFISVNEFLQLKDHKNIFVCGDVNFVKEEKTAQHAVHQAKCVVWNIRAMENGGKFKRYVGEESPLVISLGKWNGLFVYKKFVLTGIIPGLLKTAIEIREMMKYR